MKSEQLKGEFAEKWANTPIDIDEDLRRLNENLLINDLNVLIEAVIAEKDMYPKEFVEWLIWDHRFQVFKNCKNVMMWRDSNDNEYTLNKIFDYWKENER